MYKIRNAIKGDIQSIMEIEKKAFPKPWSEQHFDFEFYKMETGMNIFIVAEAEDTGAILGYAVGNVIVDYIHILNIAVSEKYRSKGIGQALLKAIENEAIKNKLVSLTLEVREKNLIAVRLYVKSGFELKACREKAYDGIDSGLIMTKKL